VQIYTNR